jgi:hypothetical protein
VIPRSAPAWIIGLHRFLEVSVGIIVALAVVACGLNINEARGKARMNNAIFANNIFELGFFLIQGLSGAWERLPRCRNIKFSQLEVMSSGF